MFNNTTSFFSLLIGGVVGTEDIPELFPGERAIISFNWDVPDPSNYSGPFAGNGFGLVARIISDDDPMTYSETPYPGGKGNVWKNAKNNNNFVWKNVEVLNTRSSLESATVTAINSTNETKEYSLEFVIDDNLVGNAIFEEAEVKIQMSDDLYQNWSTSGEVKDNFEVTNKVFKVTEDNAIIDNISLEAGEIRSLQITFNFLSDELSSKKEFKYHYVLRDKETEDIVYGKTFHIKKEETDPFDADAGDDKEIDKNQSVTLSATSINEPATYNWYDPEGNLIYTGMDFTLSPELTQEYTLEIIKDVDGLKDYDQVTIEVNPFVLGIMAPNPANNQVTINYIAEDASSSYLIFTEQNSNITYNHLLDINLLQTNIDISTYTTGIYFVSLICDGNLIETKQLIIN